MATAGQLLRTQDIYSDFKIICGFNTYYVHRIILLSHSEWFKTLLNSQFYENQPENRTVRLDSDDSVSVKAMIEYIYLSDYTVPPWTNPLTFHVNMFEVGAYFMIPHLRREAKKKLDGEMDNQCALWWFSEMTERIRALPTGSIHESSQEELSTSGHGHPGKSAREGPNAINLERISVVASEQRSRPKLQGQPLEIQVANLFRIDDVRMVDPVVRMSFSA